jgi:hypothetical protein
MNQSMFFSSDQPHGPRRLRNKTKAERNGPRKRRRKKKKKQQKNGKKKKQETNRLV